MLFIKLGIQFNNCLFINININRNYSFFFIFRIMGDHINTYTFTKALAEHVVNDARNIIRTCIVRPSMS